MRHLAPGRLRFPALALAALLVIGVPAVAAAPLAVPVGPNLQQVLFDPDAGVAYVVTEGGSGLAVLDAASGTVLRSVSGSYGSVSGWNGNIQDIALDPAGGGILAVSSADRLYRISESLAVASVQVPYDFAVSPLSADAQSGVAYLRNVQFVGPGNYVDHLLAVDLNGGYVVQDVVRQVGDLVADPGGSVYVSDGTGISVLDPTTLQTVTTIPADPYSTLALDATGDRLYAMPQVGPISVIDTTTGQVVESIPQTGSAIAFAIDPARDRVFRLRSATYPSPYRLEIFEAGFLLESVAVGTSVRDVAVNPATGDAWVTSPLAGTVTIVTPGNNPGPVDLDGDGTSDDIDADGGAGTGIAGAFSDDTGDGFVTTGHVTNAEGLAVAIVDAPDPDGVTISVGTGGGYATLSVCGGSTILVYPDSQVTVTCGSVRIAVAVGSADIVLGGGATVVTIQAGGEAKATETGGGSYSIANLGGTPVTVTKAGSSGTIAPNATQSVTTWRFDGFTHPIDNLPTRNSVKAGQAIPVKWRVLDASGAPVTSLTTATISATSLSCALGSTVDSLEELAAGASALLNLGNGYYQLNWKSPKTYASSCKTLRLSIGDGVTYDAAFQFLK